MEASQECQYFSKIKALCFKENIQISKLCVIWFNMSYGCQVLEKNANTGNANLGKKCQYQGHWKNLKQYINNLNQKRTTRQLIKCNEIQRFGDIE